MVCWLSILYIPDLCAASIQKIKKAHLSEVVIFQSGAFFVVINLNKQTNMKLQAITVSVNYSDFLIHTIKANKKVFDKWIVVTDLDDWITRRLCEENDVCCIQTDVFYTKGIFNKYAAINEGLKSVDPDAWVLFLDSDIVLHEETRRLLNSISLDEECLYGMDRLNCIGIQQWTDYKKTVGILEENWKLMPMGLEMGTRLVHHYGHEGENGKFEGWRPLGFFQLAHRSAFTTYPQDSLGADNCDLDFARKWHRSKRVLIPELYVIHLESEGARKSVNWYGRKSSPFGHKEIDSDIEAEISKLTDKCNKESLFSKIIRKIKRFLFWIFFAICWLFKKKPKPY